MMQRNKPQFSIYIPRISNTWSESNIKWIMNHCKIGTVSHVDFVPINIPPGFQHTHQDANVLSAFVHFAEPVFKSNPNPNPTPEESYPEWHPNWLHPLWKSVMQDYPYRLEVTSDEYWICLKNKTPLNRTYMNIHQVVENCKYLENMVLQQAAEIKELQTCLADLKKHNTLN